MKQAKNCTAERLSGITRLVHRIETEAEFGHTLLNDGQTDEFEVAETREVFTEKSNGITYLPKWHTGF